MPHQRPGLVPARTVTIGLIVLVLGAATASLFAQLGMPMPSFAATYVAASALLHGPGVPIYEYGALLHINAVQHFVTVGFYPFVAPPFALLTFAPLALLPFTAASFVWVIITRLCVLGAALAIGDAFFVMIARRDMAQDMAKAPSAGRLLAVLRYTSFSIGTWRFPTAPFALCSALLLLALPPSDAVSWDSPALIAVLFVAVALDAYVRGHLVLAALAIALASGFSFLPLVLVVCLLVRGAWSATIAVLLFAGAVATAPLMFLPARAYGDLAAALRLAQATYGSSDHNVSLLGAASTLIYALGHMGTQTFIQASKASTLLSVVLIAITLIALLVFAVMQRISVHSGRLPDGDQSTWLIFAVALSATTLALPLVWPDDSLFALIAMLLVGFCSPVIPVVRHRDDERYGKYQRVAGTALLVLAIMAFILYLSVLPFHLDSTDLQLLDRREFLDLARPVASVLIWASALGALFVPYVRFPRRTRARRLVPVAAGHVEHVGHDLQTTA